MKDIIKFLTSMGDEVISRLKLWDPSDYEIRAEAGCIGLPLHEANEIRKELSRIADVIAGQSNGPEGSAWKNVAWNLDPSTGRTQRVQRSFNR